ncbi:IS1182 family transposase [Phenylobacterium sp. J426]|uniref:IS1182 family transposase n=1 Tax=Phenylobacterium sp. J426 TaxID=2898439 RepID=UPI0021512763|nr:IS1182 family transposase [Phenylobacterium sp. J426]MCR5872881.1 IS1182 family transposase [Phenylobacterium sp. J426]MCR5873487.1 IS1182 family transposase [Phenylobacterium sp. J426]MCR5874957.1 IS1182 family transposase [Phenylobacterium sp. J426]MCR5874959.1 IS1182 family transposase [Phenylobacterium sp. J426]MCR5876253.1 IS1182 family transposase [Phenylobacterium sp. J426]
MSRFVEGEDRRQPVLLPSCLDDYVSDENPARLIDVFVDELDLGGLGFEIVPAATGRPAYHPAMLLKLYIYGYLNRVQSSRRLEREAQRNVELMWLTGKLAPDHKTIANFRKDNGAAIQAACAHFIVLCRQIGLFTQAVAAVDGSKFKAVNTRDKNFTPAKLKKRIEQVAEHIAGYLQELDTADRLEGEAVEARTVKLKDKIATLRAQMQALKAMEAQVEASPDGQVSLTDPDARSMATSGRGSGIVGYNVQSVVDAEHHLIVAHDVITTGSDRQQLAEMSGKAKDAMGVERLEMLADRGYFSGEEILACEQIGVTPYVPKPLTSGAKADGRFGKQDFAYVPEQDAYRCPGGSLLRRRMTTVEKGLTLHRYWDRASCQACALKPQCTPSVERRITRWEHEATIEALQRRMDLAPYAMRARRRIVEHPFGTIKAWMGHTHFLMKRLPNVKTEISLHILAYNMKRVMQMLGTGPLIAAIRT